MTDETEPIYTNRTQGFVQITSLDPITHTAWFDNPPPDDLIPLLSVGDVVGVEFVGNSIAGWRYDGVWYNRRSDQDIDFVYNKLAEAFKEKAQERLEEFGDTWWYRVNRLPEWLSARIHYFKDMGGSEFERTGLEYELIICELALLYMDHDDNSPEIEEFANREGTTGNQHAVAKALVKTHKAGKSLRGSVSALFPLTRSADYADPIYYSDPI